ncbi:alpha/beta hydrolase [Stratiformator vulcanicus]|uniref:Aminoacrylate hydrolase RutD n=1 Tax=Stratiformator vulcanicus TaxID=2527980 RepID=A0A517QVN8_9PLAN|nr:alpha/beta hydrolase [Stratiformator vulcanicus]QDT35719.1 Putative aminoacrylate hydrolase RutD [Stratiformator vulcanicus]
MRSNAHNLRRIAFRIARTIGFGYLAIVVMFAYFQRALMYPALQVERLAAQAVDHEFDSLSDVTQETSDGLTLHGWHAKPSRPEGASESDPQRRAILFFHGNGGHRGHRLWEYHLFAKFGWETIVFDYRGYGENAGSPSEDGLVADAKAAWKYATEVAGLKPSNIVLFGESLGGGVAIRLAADLFEAKTPPAALVVRSTFRTMTDAAVHRFPWLPVRLLLLDRYESIGLAQQIECPVLVFHGDRDTVIPIDHARDLFDSFPEESDSGVPRQFVLLDGADHNNYADVAGVEFQRELKAFLDKVISTEERDP